VVDGVCGHSVHEHCVKRLENGEVRTHLLVLPRCSMLVSEMFKIMADCCDYEVDSLVLVLLLGFHS
jgi:hypothetical protein